MSCEGAPGRFGTDGRVSGGGPGGGAGTCARAIAASIANAPSIKIKATRAGGRQCATRAADISFDEILNRTSSLSRAEKIQTRWPERFASRETHPANAPL